MKITGQTPYGEWLAAWVSVYKEPKLKPHSTLTIRNCIRLHIPDAFWENWKLLEPDRNI